MDEHLVKVRAVHAAMCEADPELMAGTTVEQTYNGQWRIVGGLASDEMWQDIAAPLLARAYKLVSGQDYAPRVIDATGHLVRIIEVK